MQICEFQGCIIHSRSQAVCLSYWRFAQYPRLCKYFLRSPSPGSKISVLCFFFSWRAYFILPYEKELCLLACFIIPTLRCAVEFRVGCWDDDPLLPSEILKQIRNHSDLHNDAHCLWPDVEVNFSEISHRQSSASEDFTFARVWHNRNTNVMSLNSTIPCAHVILRAWKETSFCTKIKKF